MKDGKVKQEKVIFRKFPDGDIIALFPEIAVDNTGYKCESYMHVGQHGAADTEIVRNTKLATPDEYAVLQDELERVVGYDLKIIKRFRYVHQLERMRQVERIRQVAPEGENS
jgi:hypothetical protein